MISAGSSENVVVSFTPMSDGFLHKFTIFVVSPISKCFVCVRKNERCRLKFLRRNMTNADFLLFTEIARVRASLFQINGVRKEPLQLPEAEGEPVTLNEKVYVPVKEHPDVSRRSIFFIATK